MPRDVVPISGDDDTTRFDGTEDWASTIDSRHTALTPRKPLSPTRHAYTSRTLAEIELTGVFLYVPGTCALLDDPQKTVVRSNTVANLLKNGRLEGNAGGAPRVSAEGIALLDRNPEARSRAHDVHLARQSVFAATGQSIRRPNPKTVARP